MSPTNCGTAYQRVSAWAATIPVSDSVPAMSTTPRTESASATSYDTSCAHVRIEPRSAYFESDDQPPRMKPYTPIEPIAKIRTSAMFRSATWPGMYTPAIVQPGPNGMTEKVVSAVKAARKGPRMNAQWMASLGWKLSLFRSFRRSAIGCSRPRGPARFGP